MPLLLAGVPQLAGAAVLPDAAAFAGQYQLLSATINQYPKHRYCLPVQALKGALVVCAMPHPPQPHALAP